MPARIARPAAAILTRRGPAWSCGRIFLGTLHAIAAVLPGMVRRQRGHLAAVSSLAGLLGLPGAAAYCASKQAVVTLMQSLRLDLHRLGIRVTVVCPGYVDTAMITEEERATVRGLVSADDAALRVAWAIERGPCGVLVPLVNGPGGAVGRRWLPPGPVHADRRPLSRNGRTRIVTRGLHCRAAGRPTMPPMISRVRRRPAGG